MSEIKNEDLIDFGDAPKEVKDLRHKGLWLSRQSGTVGNRAKGVA